MGLFKKNKKNKTEEVKNIDNTSLVDTNISIDAQKQYNNNDPRKQDAIDYIKNLPFIYTQNMAFDYNKENKYLNTKDVECINKLILSLYIDNLKVCKSIADGKDITKNYDLHEFFKTQINVISKASHKAWEEFFYKNNVQSITIISNAFESIKKAYEEKNLYEIEKGKPSIYLSSAQLKNCIENVNGFFKSESVENKGFEENFEDVENSNENEEELEK